MNEAEKMAKMRLIKGAAGLSRTTMDFTAMKRGSVIQSKRQKKLDKAATKEMRMYC